MNAVSKREEIVKVEYPYMIEELLSYMPKVEEEARNIELPFKASKYRLLECPHCEEVCAYEMTTLKSKCVYVCDFCENEF